jgi:hypothetical protein
MCSYCIRETRIRKVGYASRSPIMGGHSKWKMLQDLEISPVIPEVFGRCQRSPEFDRSGVDLREIRDVIDYCKQCLSRLSGGFGLASLLLRKFPASDDSSTLR